MRFQNSELVFLDISSKSPVFGRILSTDGRSSIVLSRVDCRRVPNYLLKKFTPENLNEGFDWQEIYETANTIPFIDPGQFATKQDTLVNEIRDQVNSMGLHPNENKIRQVAEQLVFSHMVTLARESQGDNDATAA